MSGNTNSGRGSGPAHRSTILSLLEVHTEGATATELATYLERTRVSTREQLVKLQTEGRVQQSGSPEFLWKLTEVEATHRSHLTPAPRPLLPLPARSRSRSR